MDSYNDKIQLFPDCTEMIQSIRESKHNVHTANGTKQLKYAPFRDGGIACLSDPDSYAGWSFYTPVRASQARQVEG